MSLEHSPTRQSGIRVIRKAELEQKTGLSAMQIGRLEKDGDFPRRIRLGANSVGWIELEVDEWITRRAAERDA